MMGLFKPPMAPVFCNDAADSGICVMILKVFPFKKAKYEDYSAIHDEIRGNDGFIIKGVGGKCCIESYPG